MTVPTPEAAPPAPSPDADEEKLFGILDRWADKRAAKAAEDAAKAPARTAEDKPKGIVQQILGM